MLQEPQASLTDQHYPATDRKPTIKQCRARAPSPLKARAQVDEHSSRADAIKPPVEGLVLLLIQQAGTPHSTRTKPVAGPAAATALARLKCQAHAPPPPPGDKITSPPLHRHGGYCKMK